MLKNSTAAAVQPQSEVKPVKSSMFWSKEWPPKLLPLRYQFTPVPFAVRWPHIPLRSAFSLVLSGLFEPALIEALLPACSSQASTHGSPAAADLSRNSIVWLRMLPGPVWKDGPSNASTPTSGL